MITLIQIRTLDVPELIPYRTLRQPVEHFHQGMFIAEGEKVVRQLLESNLYVLSVLLTPERLKHYEQIIAARAENIKVFVADKNLLGTIVGFNLHQGIMALGKIPVQASLESALSDSPSPYLFVAIEGLTNSENIGVLVRNCAAFGVQAILVGETSSSPYLRRAVRNSLGTVFKIPIVHCENLADTLRLLQDKYGFKVIAAHPHSAKYTINKIDLTDDCCIIFGSEGEGLSKRILEVCNAAAAIPMQLGVDSLNVANANAVFLYEVARQRKKL